MPLPFSGKHRRNTKSNVFASVADELGRNDTNHGKFSKGEIRDTCQKFGISRSVVDRILVNCSKNKDGRVGHIDFANHLKLELNTSTNTNTNTNNEAEEEETRRIQKLKEVRAELGQLEQLEQDSMKQGERRRGGVDASIAQYKTLNRSLMQTDRRGDSFLEETEIRKHARAHNVNANLVERSLSSCEFNGQGNISYIEFVNNLIRFA